MSLSIYIKCLSVFEVTQNIFTILWGSAKTDLFIY